jgi:hypothetical protein
MMLLDAAVVGIFFLAFRIATTRSFALKDLLFAGALTLVVFVLLPLLLFLRAKTATRLLTTSPDGIYTEIGAIRAQIPWRKIKLVESTDHYVLVAKLGGNSFFIPNRAFSDSASRVEFIAEIKRWMKAD